ncbi:hypothetical protein VCR3J2_310265 [Vibrio coralliirubri]|uniref:hypothetical protein n=1 Tax=Vibrio coralliirubri TaxID=1516159 RepID=UPI000636C947|nr:hypothetical protein [Vibrio coralliirubri]CDT86966.1 hypothetical protein VCR3J2_310265 [Vibrio coralliirubri]
MANPKAQVNYETFLSFVCTRDAEGDWEDYLSRDKCDLNKQAIARECGFDRKRINENSKIIEKYAQVINGLIKKGIIKKENRTGTEKAKIKNSVISNNVDKKALKASQERNVALEHELRDTKDRLIKTEKRLQQLEAIESYMMVTGRL